MKFIGIILLLVVVVSGYASWDTFNTKPLSVNTSDSQSLKQLQDLRAATSVDQTKIKQLASIQQQIQQIQSYQATQVNTQNLVAQVPIVKKVEPIVKAPAPKPVLRGYERQRVLSQKFPPYELSMIFIAPNNRYAVINERLARVGDKVVGGAEIVDIQPGEVTIKLGKRKKSLSLAEDY